MFKKKEKKYYYIFIPMFKRKKKNIRINLMIDTDNDGLTDFEEKYIYGTDPKNPDTDGDGLLDGFEVKIGTDPNIPNTFHNLFIPHQGNNYHPLALRPKRLAFHGGALILIKLIIIGFIFVYPIEAWLTPDLSSLEGQKIIALTNNIRVGLGVKPLSENDRLTRAAFDKAQDMLVNNYFNHISPKNLGLAYFLGKRDYNYRSAGENLAMGFATAEEVVKGWKNSRTHYMNMIDRDFTEIGVGLVSGDYNDQNTTLVAQLFGEPAGKNNNDQTPYQNNTLKIKTASKAGPARLKSENTIKAELLAAKIIGKIEKSEPELVSPLDNAILSERLVKFEIFAPQAENIVLYIDQKPLMMKNLPIDKNNLDKKYYYELTKEIEPGPHSILIKSIKGQEELFSKKYNISVDTEAPQADLVKSKIIVSSISNENKELVAADIYLSADTARAQLQIDGQYFDLNQDAENINRWSVREFIDTGANQPDGYPIVLANVTSVDHAGQTMVTDIPYKNIELQKPSFIGKYFFLKDHQNKYISQLFDVSSIYYRLLLISLILAMALNMFVEIKKQKVKAIVSSFGLLCLLAVLIVF